MKQNCAPSWTFCKTLLNNLTNFHLKNVIATVTDCFNTLRKGDADLRFYITTVQDG